MISRFSIFAAVLFFSSVSAWALPIFWHTKVSESFDEAELVLNHAMESQEVLDQLGMSSIVAEVKKRFPDIKRKSRAALLQPICHDTLGYYVPGHDDKIHLCPSILKKTTHEIAQTILHESIHASGVDSECKTTSIELTIAILGGMRPFANGYVGAQSDGIACMNNGHFDKNWSQWVNAKLGFHRSQDVRAWIFAMQVKVRKVEPAAELVGYSKNINLLSPFGTTALMESAMIGNIKWIQALLKVPGIDREMRSNDGFTAYDYAENNGFSKAANLLR